MSQQLFSNCDSRKFEITVTVFSNLMKHNQNNTRFINFYLYLSNVKSKWQITLYCCGLHRKPNFTTDVMNNDCWPHLFQMRSTFIRTGWRDIPKGKPWAFHFLKKSYLRLLIRCQKLPKSDFQSQFSMSKIDGIFLIFFHLRILI